MLKRFLKQLRLITSPQGIRVGCGVLVAVFVVLLTTHVAHADDITPISIPGLATLVSDSLANFFYSFQTIASWLIYLAGALLNFSINLTMHIKEFVTATPAIYTVWKAIRDISGMFLIFALLYAAIMLITGLKKPNFGELIKNIVVAGVLINFSFFITGLAIDVSNVVSIQLYNAIAPAQTLNGGTPTDKTGILNRYIEQGKADGGLSTIFMQSLGVTRLYNPDGSISSTGKNVAQATQQNPNNAWATPVKIILIGVTSIIIMITAALSFFLAALAFIVRFVILIFLLAFSPILFASFVVPEIGKYATMWKTQLKNQLVFMPVYLLLMYFALSVLTSSSIFQNGYAGNLTSNGGFLGDLMVLALNAVLVIVMLNAPLLGAMSVGAMVPKWASNVTADKIWRKVGGAVGGGLGRATIGRGASAINDSIDASTTNRKWLFGKSVAKLGNTVVGRDLRAATLGAATKAKFGDSRSYEDIGKLEKEIAKKNKEFDRSGQFSRALVDPTIPDPIDRSKLLLDTSFGGMNEKQKLGLGKDTLVKPEILVRMKASDFEAIKKADEGFTDEDKQEIADARKNLLTESALRGEHGIVKKLIENMNDDQKKSLSSARDQALRNAITSGNADTVKHLVQDMDGKELLKIERNTAGTIDHAMVIEHLTSGQLKKLSEEGLDSAVKVSIGTRIMGLAAAGTPHRAVPFIRKNLTEWT